MDKKYVILFPEKKRLRTDTLYKDCLASERNKIKAIFYLIIRYQHGKSD